MDAVDFKLADGRSTTLYLSKYDAEILEQFLFELKEEIDELEAAIQEHKESTERAYTMQHPVDARLYKVLPEGGE